MNRNEDGFEPLNLDKMVGGSHDEWTEIGKRCSAGRRSVWMRLVFWEAEPSSVDVATVKRIELRAGREGCDLEIQIDAANPQFPELLELFKTAHFAATT